jgi:hypothetical protein
VCKRSGTASRHVAWPWNVSERSAGKQWPEGRQKLNGGLMYAARDCNGTGAREDRSVYVCVYVWVRARARARGLVRVTARARVKGGALHLICDVPDLGLVDLHRARLALFNVVRQIARRGECGAFRWRAPSADAPTVKSFPGPLDGPPRSFRANLPTRRKERA